jgi:predicted metal-dependent phosphoesterase TrpH
MFKVDLHTHSVASPDGSTLLSHYKQVLESGLLDFIAITDHDHIDFALQAQTQLGERIIVGQEITTSAGEIIGLFLTKLIQPGLTPLETVEAIKSQNGLVYVPHPFETVRHGLSAQTLNEIADSVDIIEVHNGRAIFQNRGPQAAAWAKLHHRIRAASSDAHGRKGLGHAYTETQVSLNRNNFMDAVGRGRLITARPPLSTLLYPKLNRLRKKVGKQ